MLPHPSQTLDVLYSDYVEIEMLRGDIAGATAELDEARTQVVNEKDPAEVAAKEKEIKESKTKVQSLQRDMRTLMKEARARYDTHVAKNILSTAIPSSTSGVVQPTPLDMKIDDPSKFDGKQNDYARWLFECKNVLSVRTRIDTEEKRIRYLGSRMEGAALMWYELYMNRREAAIIRGEGAIYTYQHFLTAFDTTFKDPLEKQTNRNLVKASKQGKMLFNDYQLHFLNLTLKADLDVNTQIETFLPSLNASVLEAWKPQIIPTTYTEVVSSIRVALQVHHTLQQALSLSRGGGNKGLPLLYNAARDSSKPGPFMANIEKEGWKQRRMKGLCTRCGMSNHKSESCHVYPAHQTNVENFNKWKRVNQGGTTSPNTTKSSVVFNNIHVDNEDVDCDNIDTTTVDNKSTADAYTLYIGVMRPNCASLFFIDFHIPNKTTPTICGKALIDSGANRSLISKEFVNRNGIGTSILSDIMYLTLADGVTKKAVTCQTHSIPLVINGHEERIELPVFDSTEYDMILGLDWLMKHNPRIDWNTHSLIFSDPNLNVCVNMVTNLHATTPAVTNDELYQLPPPSWPMSEFPKVFDMKEQMQLPKQREEWDFDVKFKENEPLPRCRPLFKLPRHQQELVADFIRKELKSGKIRVSNSPVGANLFFVLKNDSTTELRPCIEI
ncbi:hypothetical protein SeMB42_g04821 [Synchytrium endobioticum]|uniref:Ty3 transposon capsid-like protein domain-containing protein n=2 Tax=Synchytrium endobioticum TaxID=286115 RepID=A0A507CVL5_9FUNG|nr:hypothetical protein SeMB42_g04821 [Synchytrium endobioticum]